MKNGKTDPYTCKYQLVWNQDILELSNRYQVQTDPQGNNDTEN